MSVLGDAQRPSPVRSERTPSTMPGGAVQESILPPKGHSAAMGGEVLALRHPLWSLRVEGRRLYTVLERASLPSGIEITELSVALPHVSFPFDFREGIQAFQHYRGVADELSISLDAHLMLRWLNEQSNGVIGGLAYDDQLVLSGSLEGGKTRFTMKAKWVPSEEPHGGVNEALLMLSLYDFRVYGPTDLPWPAMAKKVLDLLPEDWVVDRSLTTARLRVTRLVLLHALSPYAWKMPDLSALKARAVELRQGRFVAYFSKDEAPVSTVELQLDEAGGYTYGQGREGYQQGFLRFVEDLELKRHHGQIDRLLFEGKTREAVAEIYRSMDGSLRPGFLAERLIGICTSQAILYDEGERVARLLLEQDGEYIPALVGLSTLALAKGQVEEAIAQLERLSSLFLGPSDREDATAVDLTLARLLAGIDKDAAERVLERILERAPDHEEALSRLIELAESEGQRRRAMPLYKRLLFAARSRERIREAGLRLAGYALEHKEPEDARVFLKVVLEAYPEDVDAKVALSEVEIQEGRAEAAFGLLNSALRDLKPEDERGHSLLVIRLARLLLEVLADPERARRILWRAADLRVLPDEDALALARLSVLADEAALALRFSEGFDASSPHWADLEAVRAEAYLLRNNEGKALECVLNVLSQEPDHSLALSLIEKATPQLDRRQWLVFELQELAKKSRQPRVQAQIFYRVSLLFQSIGLHFDAIEPLKRSFALSQDDESFHERGESLMLLLSRYGLWPEFLEAGQARLERLMKKPLADGDALKERAELLIWLGRVALMELGDGALAAKWLEQGTMLLPRSDEAHELLVKALERQMSLRQVGARTTLSERLARALIRYADMAREASKREALVLKLAELQWYELREKGQAKASLGRLHELKDSPAAEKLRAALEGEKERPLTYGAAPDWAASSGPTAGISRPTGIGGPGDFSPALRDLGYELSPLEGAAEESQGSEDYFQSALEAADRHEYSLAREELLLHLQAKPFDEGARDFLAYIEKEIHKKTSETESTPKKTTALSLPDEDSLKKALKDVLSELLLEAKEPKAAAFEPDALPFEPEIAQFEAHSARLREDAEGEGQGDAKEEDWGPDPDHAQVLLRPSPLEKDLKEALHPSVNPGQDMARHEDGDTPAPLLTRPKADEGLPSGEAGKVIEKIGESDRIDALMGRAVESYFEGDLESSETSLHEVLAIDPDVVSALELLQDVLAAGGQHKARVGVLLRLIPLVFDLETQGNYQRLLGESHALLGEELLSARAYAAYLQGAPLDEALFQSTKTSLLNLGGLEDKRILGRLHEARYHQLMALSEGTMAKTELKEALAFYDSAGADDELIALALGQLETSPEDESLLTLLVRALLRSRAPLEEVKRYGSMLRGLPSWPPEGEKESALVRELDLILGAT